MKRLTISLMVLFSFIPLCASSAIDNNRAKDKNIKIVQALYSDFAKRDISVVLQRFDPKIEWNEAENFPYADGNPYVGPNAVVEGVFNRPGTEWDYWNLPEQKYHEEKNGDIIVTGRYKAKNKETGEIISTQFVHMW
jgi:ketosteroid isomerase-like protein